MSSEAPKPLGSTQKKTGNKKGGAPKASASEMNEPVSLVRQPELGMNPRGILTGYYGSRGERIRHTIHDGALRMPKEALDIIAEATGETKLTAPTSYELPGLDSVVRPCIDPTLETLIVTELSMEMVAVPQPPPPPQEPGTTDETKDLPAQPSLIHVLQTKAENRTVIRTLQSANTTERIRGGGGDDDTKLDVDSAVSSSDKLASAPSQPSGNPVTITQEAPTTASQTPASSSPAPAPAPASVPAASEAPSNATAQTDPQAGKTPEPSSAAPAVQPGQPSSSQASAPAAGQYTQPPIVAQPGHRAAPAASTVPPTTQNANASMWPPTSAVAAFAATPNPAPTVALASTTPASATTTGAADKVQSAPAVATTKIEPLPNVQTLSTKPAPQWEQHRPGPNDEMVTPVDQLTPKPSWYTKDGVADMERAMLPEWFDSSAPHRTPDSYIQVREKIILMSDTIANRNVTNSMIRRSVMGDAGSLQRLRNFLVNFGLINEDGINDSAPTPAVLRVQNTTTAPKRFSDEIQDELVRAVVQQSKRQKIDDSDKSEFSFVPIDWEQVAAQVGRGTTSIECERNFLSTPLNEDRAMGTTERSITPDGSHDTNKNAEAAADSGKQQKQSPSEESKEILLQELLRDLVEKTNPDIITTVTQTAMEVADNSLQQAQSAAQLGLMASRAVGEARTQENALASVLSQLVNQRMEKLENRMALLDDIEGIIEAEKVALELERRDLYTARCRHWFGGA